MIVEDVNKRLALMHDHRFGNKMFLLIGTYKPNKIEVLRGQAGRPEFQHILFRHAQGICDALGGERCIHECSAPVLMLILTY